MSSFLLSVGDAAGRSLPVVFTALSCGAALPVPSLSVFSLSRAQDSCAEAEFLVSSISACRALSGEAGGFCVFPSGISFGSCVPLFRDLRNISGDPDTSLLFDALRGKGIPLSARLDRESAEWCFADLLSRPEDESVQPFFSWLSGIAASPGREDPARLTILADLSDPFSSGVTLALLPFLRSFFEKHSVHITLLALAETLSPLPESFFPSLSAALQALEDRSLLRLAEEETPRGADAVWLLSLPSSMVRDADSHRVTALAAARLIGVLSGGETPPPPGFHTKEIDGTLSLASLGEQASSFAAFLRASVWLLSDLLPALRSHLSHPSRLRSLAMNPRTALFRRLFPSGGNTISELSGNISLLESALKTILSDILSFLRSVPDALRPSGENASLWQQAVNSCGRYITVASEYDTTAAEARESGLDTVRPVHRVSMADTEEEQLIRRLQDMNRQLEDEIRAKESILSSLGGYRSFQVQLDCYNRCTAALKEAREKAALPADGLDHLSLLKRARRVRLLEAAVARCRSDLSPASVQASISAPPSAKASDAGPYAFCPLDADYCRALESLLAASGEDAAPRIPLLFPAVPNPDPKTRVRALAASCGEEQPERPLPFLFEKVLSVCREELAGVRFHPDTLMPAVPLLPDVIVDSPLLRLKDVLSRMPGLPVREEEISARRGVLAMILLRQYRRRLSSEASPACACCMPGASPVLRYWLSARQAEKAYILSLEKEEVSLPFALVIPGRAFLPARRIAAHAELVPSFVTWYDRESDTFLDPCPFLGEADRLLLKELLASYLNELGSSGTPLAVLLREFLQDLSREPEPFAADEHLRTRLCAAFGLRNLSAYEPSLTRETCAWEHFLVSDPAGSCLTGREDFPASVCTDIPEDVLYLYRGVPFAREDSRLLLADPHTPGEDYTLSRLSAECAVLSESSDDYRDAVLKNLQEYLDRCPSALPETRETASALLDEVSKPVDRKEPVFVWPWDEKSPSVLTVLRESLGESIPAEALHPFSDLLSVFPARGRDIIGDALLSAMCTLLPREDGAAPEGAELVPDAVLPPLSPSFGRVLCMLPEGRTMMKPGLLTFERFREDKPGFQQDVSDSVRVTLTLDGAFPVHLVRVYAPEEILHLYAHDIPTVALWPSVPFRPEDWHAYFMYAHMPEPYSVSVLSASGEWTEVPLTSEDRRAAQLSSFPLCLSVFREEQTAGLLPNVLPEPLVASSEPVEVCIDFGSAGTSVVFSSGSRRRPMHGPVLVRTLLNNPASSRDLLRREFIPAVPVSALLPTVSRIFRNAPGAAPVPFADGIVLMSSGLEDLLSTPSDAIYMSLKWEEEKGRSGFLCLHQVMLMAALQARFEGAPALSWRFSLPDEMAKEGRDTLMNLFLSLSENVLRESGYPLTGADGGLPLLRRRRYPRRLHGAGSGRLHGGYLPFPARTGAGCPYLPDSPGRPLHAASHPPEGSGSLFPGLRLLHGRIFPPGSFPADQGSFRRPHGSCRAAPRPGFPGLFHRGLAPRAALPVPADGGLRTSRLFCGAPAAALLLSDDAFRPGTAAAGCGSEQKRFSSGTDVPVHLRPRRVPDRVPAAPAENLALAFSFHVPQQAGGFPVPALLRGKENGDPCRALPAAGGIPYAASRVRRPCVHRSPSRGTPS